MRLPPRLRFLQDFNKRLQKPARNPMLFLNITQFFSILNDNLYKLFMIFMLIGTLGKESANTILSAAGAVFVIPFILFSSSAGILADRFSKQRFLVIMKTVEITVMFLAMFAFYFKSVWASYTLLFLLATHSSLFGPPKYSIIPELVDKQSVPKANGLITSFAYIAIIFGTFLASFFTEITNRNFLLAAFFCFLIAITGFLATLKIPYTKPQGSTKKLNFFFIREVYKTLRFASEKEHLFMAIVGSSYFLFIGAFTQLNIIPYAMQSLNLNEVAGGYLFLSTAVGIAIGSIIAGKLAKKKLDLGLSCFSCLGISVLLLFLSCFSANLFLVIFFLILLGICGGLFVVPFDSFIQITSPDEKRGEIIGAGNFLSFFGVLLASIALYLLGNVWKLSAAQGFGFIAFITFLVVFLLFFRLSDLSLPYLAKRALSPFYRIQSTGETPSLSSILIMEKATFFKVLTLSCIVPRISFYILQDKHNILSLLSKISYSFYVLPTNITLDSLPRQSTSINCLLIKDKLPEHLEESKSFFGRLLQKFHSEILYASFSSDKKKGIFSRELITVSLLSHSLEGVDKF